MKLTFDYRVLTHKSYTGVENYAKSILLNIKDICEVTIARPTTTNRYLAHIWSHLILPFKGENLLFCPANIAPIFVPKNKKLIVTIHDVAFQTYPNSFSKFFRLYYKLIIPINIKRADKIITVSNSSKKEIEKYYPYSKDKIKVIYLGYDASFKLLDIKRKKQILYVGSINERKNFIGVLKAFEQIGRTDYQLLIIGNFSLNFEINQDTQQMIEQAKQNTNVEFKSAISNDELIKIYNESELFVFPSFYEGFGLPVLEAMACGTPVICSGTTSLPEVGGDAVVYCNPHSVSDIKNKIELVLGNKALQKDMIKKGLERTKKFSWKKSAQEHLQILKFFDDVK